MQASELYQAGQSCAREQWATCGVNRLDLVLSYDSWIQGDSSSVFFIYFLFYYHLQGKIPNPENQKILKLCKYVGDFLLITTQFLFAAKIHSKGMKLIPEKFDYFLILCYNSRTVRDRKKVSRQKLLLLLRSII